MSRYMRIENAAFDQVDLPFPLSVKLGRFCQPLPAGSDSQTFATSVQLGAPMISAEVRLRGTAVAESLELGRAGELRFTVAPTCSGQKGRSVSLNGAVLHAAELTYEQTAMATALLRFVAAAPAGDRDPLAAEDLP